MEYEKKYNEALERARDFHDGPTANVVTRTFLEQVFPELRESEDEAIRKSIVATIEQCPDDFLNPKNRDRMLAYLEKQKEPHIPWYDYQKSKEAGYTIVPNEEYEQLIKQKDQKPAEWSEEDENMLWNIISIVGESKSIQADEMLDWLKSLRPQPHWKPSKEQMNYLSAAVIEAQRRHNESTNGFTRYHALKEIYEQLLKL